MKHYLRFILVLLLSTVWCVGGYSQEKPEVTLDFTSSSNPWKFPEEYIKDGKAYTYTYNGYTITIQGGTSGAAMWNNVSKINYFLQLNSKGATLSLPAFDFAVSKIVLEMYSPAKGLKQNIYVDNVAVSTEVSGNKSYSFEINSNKQAANTIYQIKNSGAASKIKKIHIYKAASSKIPTNTTFGADVDKKTFPITEGEIFPTHVATMTTAGVTGTIAYFSDNAAVKVDQNGVTSAGTGFGMAKITATFTPADADTYASSSAYYYIDYKEKTKPATAISFEKQNVTLTTLDYASFTGQTATLKAGETTLTNELTYSKEDAAGVITTLNNDGTLVLSGKEGTATVTATFAGNDEYASSTASYTITVVDPNKLEVTFDFANNKYGYGISNNGNGVGDVPVNGTIVSDNGIVTITNLQNGTNNNTTFYDDNLRFYSESKTSISVPEGYLLKKIISSANMVGNSFATWTSGKMGGTAKEWVATENVNSVTFTANNKIKMANMTVYYAKVDPTVTFDEEKYDNLSNYDKKTVDVTMKRTIGIGYLNPVCFPFAMDATQITEVFGEGSKVSAMAEDMPDGNLHFDYVETMEAGMPYLVEPTKASTTVEVKNVTINAKPGYDVAADNGGNLYSFQGTFNPYAFTAIDGTELFLGKDNTLYMPQSVGQKMKGFRAYFTTPKANESLKVVVNGQTTTISSLMSGKTMTGKVYNLNGQYVGTSLEGLAKGIYVMNGQKFVVK